MSRGRVTFKQCDVERLLRAYQKLGFEPSQVSLRVDRHGTISARVKDEDEPPPGEWDIVLPMGDGHHA
jgi:hypothetical protein